MIKTLLNGLSLCKRHALLWLDYMTLPYSDTYHKGFWGDFTGEHSATFLIPPDVDLKMTNKHGETYYFSGGIFLEKDTLDRLC